MQTNEKSNSASLMINSSLMEIMTLQTSIIYTTSFTRTKTIKGKLIFPIHQRNLSPRPSTKPLVPKLNWKKNSKSMPHYFIARKLRLILDPTCVFYNFQIPEDSLQIHNDLSQSVTIYCCQGGK